MLIEIRADVFRKGPVVFGEGLNVVLGDENATNSIGKSSLLMVVDFAFGGSSLLDHNRDLVKELDHHYYFLPSSSRAKSIGFGVELTIRNLCIGVRRTSHSKTL